MSEGNTSSAVKTPLKYQQLMDELLAMGCHVPILYAPNNIKACRFSFSDPNRPNHLPQYVSNPRRMLLDIGKHVANTSLLALSCFTTPEKATMFYANLRKAFRNVTVSIGDSLSEGILTDDDGMITAPTANGHFDLYEYEGCDLNKTFHITRKLIDNEKDRRL